MTPLEELNEAVQKFVQSRHEHPVLTDVSLLVWEVVSYDDEGDVQRKIEYAVPSENFSLSSVLGLLAASNEYVKRAILGAD